MVKGLVLEISERYCEEKCRYGPVASTHREIIFQWGHTITNSYRYMKGLPMVVSVIKKKATTTRG